MLSNSNNTNKFAQNIRLESIKSMVNIGSGHVGGVLSVADLLAVLYDKIMNYDPKNPKKEDRDRLVLSKGHCGPALYAALALKGFFPMEWLKDVNMNETHLPSHCSMKDTPGVDMTTGSLGQGASAAAGIALGQKIKKQDSFTYLILGDGECNEGQVWEMVLFAAHHKLSNLIAFVDENKKQLDGLTKDICDMGDIAKKFDSFDWHSQYIDGHDIDAIEDAIKKAQNDNRPSVIVLNTIKGKGWNKIENTLKNHHSTVNQDDIIQLEKDLENCFKSSEMEEINNGK